MENLSPRLGYRGRYSIDNDHMTIDRETIGYFVGNVTIFTHEQGGRRSPAFNGIRWDFALADDPSPAPLFMIWPDFRDNFDRPFPPDAPLPTNALLPARFHLSLRHVCSIPISRLKIGTLFFCHEGAQRVASGVITDVSQLSTQTGE